MRALIALLLFASSAFAEVSSRAAFMRHVVGAGTTSSHNVASITKPGTGTYLVTLTAACPHAAGVANVNSSRGDGSCFGDFTAAGQITVTCRRASDNALVDIPNGTVVVMTAYCGTP
jgi:hypothetical protein